MIIDQGSTDLSDPTFASQGRNFMEGGLYPTGDPIDPLKFYRGSGATNESNPKFLFDGDPVNGTGWVNSVPGDIRILINNGPFSFGMDTEQEIIYALMVTQGTDALNSVTRLLELDPRVQALYDSNFDLIKLLAINNQNKNLPGSFSLGDPYPNPFNPVVYIPLNISFAPSNTKIHVGIYNISGELVWDKTIISRERTHTIKWEGTTLEGKAAPSGMYFVRVTDGVITQTRRIVLLK
jgi:hypothetical protein